MGGSELGFIGGPGVEAVTQINEEIAAEVAKAKADRTIFAFRRTHIFNRTFQRTLDRLNDAAGINPEFPQTKEIDDDGAMLYMYVPSTEGSVSEVLTEEERNGLIDFLHDETDK